jgi:Ca2+-binding RTX toxin-like protein
MSNIGSNLSGVASWSGQHAFIDRMKTASHWSAQDASLHGIDVDLPLDEAGYLTRMPDNVARVYCTIGLDPVALATPDRYVITYEGDADIELLCARVISRSEGRIVFEYEGQGTANSDELVLILSNIPESDPIHDIHVVRADQEQLFNQGEIFNPDFIDRISTWDTLRFMDWGATNGSDLQNWNDRPRVDDRTYAGEDGVPLEIMVKLANEAKTDMWYNVPAEASDDFVLKALTYIRDHLDPTLRVHVEYSNEVWNWMFDQSHYAMEQADRLWGTDVNGDGHIDPNSAAEHVQDGWLQFYGYRSAQIAGMAKTLWGDNAEGRLVTEISTQTTVSGLEKAIFAGAEKAGVGAIWQIFDDYAITGYIDGGMTFAGSDPEDALTVLGWARGGRAGMDAAFHELEFGGTLTFDFSLAAAARAYAYQAQVANTYGLTLSVYEGGAHLVAANYPAEYRAEIVAFFDRLITDPRMADLYAKNVAAFAAAGGELFNQFNDVGSSSQYGHWGMIDNIYSDSVRWDTLEEMNGPKVQGRIICGNGNGNALIGTDGRDQMDGGAGDDTLRAGAEHDTVYGGAGADKLYGEDGSDFLDGGAGSDILYGGMGNDTFVVDQITDKVVELTNQGFDVVRAGVNSHTLSSNLEALFYTGQGDFVGRGNELANRIIGGAGDDRLLGNAGDDTLISLDGDDRLDGGAGADTLQGGKGDDIYIIDDTGDRLTEAADEGYDRVYTTLSSYWLPANVEELKFDGTGSFNGTGNALDNKIIGGRGNDSLGGGDGDDKLYGGDGNDLLGGGAGRDLLYGGAGNDSYFVDAGDKVIEKANEGIDSVSTEASYVLPNHVENLGLSGYANVNGTGNDGANTIYGNVANNRLLGLGGADIIGGDAGNDTIDGGDGNDNLSGSYGNDVLLGGSGDDLLNGGSEVDRMEGGGGNDTYWVDNAGDLVIEEAGRGADAVRASVSYQLTANVEQLSISGSAAYGRGNDLANEIYDDTSFTSGRSVELSGYAGDDGLNGGANNNVIFGGDGADRLNGGGGNDLLIGGAGADSLVGGAGADRFSFLPGDLTASATTTDKVWDFSHAEGDKLDFSAIDARQGGGDDAFAFIGGASFSGQAGQLRVEAYGAWWQITGDVNGDRQADFLLQVSRTPNQLELSDFIL